MRRRGLLAVFGATAIALAVHAAASAGVGEVPAESLGSSGGLRYIVGEYPTYNEGDIIVSAFCEQDEGVVGGGADTDGPPADSRLSGSFASDNKDDPDQRTDDGWATEGANLTSEVKTIRTFAICRTAGSGGITYLYKEGLYQAGETKTIKARCPRGRVPISGGPFLFEAEVRRSEPFDGGDRDRKPDDGWFLKAKNLTDLSQDLSISVTCMKRKRAGARYVSEEGKVAAGGSRTLRAKCPEGKPVSGGGFAIGGSQGFPHALIPRDLARDGNSTPDDAFAATLVNGAASKRKASVVAICLK